MQVYSQDFPPDESGLRSQPYTGVVHDPRGHYYDFVTCPELIPYTLEDFIPFEEHPAIPRFYELIRWLNSPESVLETNDCRFEPAETNISTNVSSKALQAILSLMLFYREPERNLANYSHPLWGREYVAGTEVLRLRDLLVIRLRDNTPFSPDLCFRVGTWPTLYTKINRPDDLEKIGHLVGLNLYIWGDDEAEIFKNMDTGIEALSDALHLCENDVKKVQAEVETA